MSVANHLASLAAMVAACTSLSPLDRAMHDWHRDQDFTVTQDTEITPPDTDFLVVVSDAQSASVQASRRAAPPEPHGISCSHSGNLGRYLAQRLISSCAPRVGTAIDLEALSALNRTSGRSCAR